MSIENLLVPNNYQLYLNNVSHAYGGQYLVDSALTQPNAGVNLQNPCDFTGVSAFSSINQFSVNTVGAANAITYTGTVAKKFAVVCVVNATVSGGPAQLTWKLNKALTPIPGLSMKLSGSNLTYGSVVISGLVSLLPSESISLFVTNNTNALFPVIHDMSMTLTEVD